MTAVSVCPTCGSFHEEREAKGKHIGVYCLECGKWKRWAPQPVSLDRAKVFVMPFGMHRGKQLSEIPDDYLDWLYEHCGNEKIAQMAQLVYEGRP